MQAARLRHSGGTTMHSTTTDLQVSDAARIEAHLLRLCAEDRSLRFSAGVVSDDTIRAYVHRIRFGHDLVLGLVGQCGHLFGLAHGCVFTWKGQPQIEAAFSVDIEWRGQGLGKALMQSVQSRASERASQEVALLGMCAVRNWPMRRIFERAGLSLRREDDEMHALGRILPRAAGGIASQA